MLIGENMKNILVMCGGKSAEHDISLITENLVLNAIDEEKYKIFPIKIDKENHWFYIKDFKNNIQSEKGKKEVFLKFGDNALYTNSAFGLKKIAQIDCALLCHHGIFGEDGTVQSILEYSNIPYSSSKVLSSAISMDKVVMKLLFKEFGFNVVDYDYFTREEYENREDELLNKVAQNLSFPLIIKPANLGSSIGISVAKNIDEFKKSVEIAFCYDDKILIEKQIEDFREINSAVLGYGDEIILSSLEEPASFKEFLTFDDKYLGKGKEGSREYPAKVEKDVEDNIKETSRQIFKKFELSGVVRIDYILKGKEIFVNEINSIPGSLAYYLFEKEKLSFSEVIDKLIYFAMQKHKDKNRLTFAYQSNVLEKNNIKK